MGENAPHEIVDIALLSSLERLLIESDDRYMDLSPLSSLYNLTHLELHSGTISAPHFLQKMTKLQKLTLGKKVEISPTAKPLRFDECTSLKSLAMAAVTLKIFQTFPMPSQLEELSIEGEDFILGHIPCILKKFHLLNVRTFGDGDIEVMVQYFAIKQLESVALVTTSFCSIVIHFTSCLSALVLPFVQS
jgi:hypothetical protein